MVVRSVQKLNKFYIRSVVRKALEEDLKPRGDITTNLINSKDKIIKAKIIAKQDGIIAGLDFCKIAFKEIGISLKWKGKGLKEKGYDSKNNKILVEVDKRYFRPTEVDFLQGNANKAKRLLNWKPKINLDQLIEEMISVDLKAAKEEFELMKIKNSAN